MGKLEEEARWDRRKGYLQDAVLGTVAVAGILAVAMIAPNTLQLLGGMGGRKRRFGEQARTALGRLADKGLVTFEKRDGKSFARITLAGQKELALQEQMAALRIKKRKRWDKRYRVVIFDVPEHRRAIRNSLRNTMRSAGFLQLQQSVWVYPHDCEDLIALLKADLHIGKDVLYLIVEKIERDAWIKKHFGIG